MAHVLTVAGFVGEVLTVECVFDASHPEKKGAFSASGNLKKVLEESLVVARIVAARFLSQEQINFARERSIHVHFKGASQKDGPSAGVSIATAYLSLLLNKPVPGNIAMTGELSLNGDVCAIGGVQAKVTAAKALEISQIILPYGNLAAYLELPQALMNGMTAYFVRDYKEAFQITFGDSIPATVDLVKDGVHIKATRPVLTQAE
eukprot:TRINITY_DN8544_c0_g2_i2.p1 TRINITY_DN8544_c0_g2~~TRINITY_DN8544_c0_g2_i2.p1  ORF type:complete len:205 (-),score=57.43 TRINITY_DN8544_c0_g2_i2:8-622(-)